MTYRSGCIVVFAKAPIPGAVKSRLVPVYGKRKAAELYRQMLLETLAKAAGLTSLELWCSPNPRHPFLHRCAKTFGARCETQQGRDLGSRMHRAFANVLRRHRWAIIVGSDCVSLSRSDLDVACATLARGSAGAVLGPAADGGYVLLGLRSPDPSLFHGIPWGSDRVLGATRRRLGIGGYDWKELPVRWDADRPDDVRRWMDERRRSGGFPWRWRKPHRDRFHRH